MRSKSCGASLVACLSLLFFSNGTFSQKITSVAKEPWHVQEMSHATGNFYSLTSFKKSIVYLPQGEVASAVRFDGENWGVVKLNSSGKQVWQLKTKGAAKGIARYKNDLIVIYSDEHEHKKGGLYAGREASLSKIITAVLISGSTGKIIKEKVIHTNQNACYTDARILTNSDGSISNILLRVTKVDKAMMDKDKEHRHRLNSERLLLIGISDDLNAKVTEVHSPSKEELFMGSEAGPNGSFFLASLTEESLVVEHIQNDGKRIGRLESPVSLKKYFNIIQPIVAIDANNPNSLFVGLNYTSRGKDPMNESFEFNFSTKKVSGSGPQEINKSYSKDLEFERIDGLGKPSKHTESSFNLIDILISSDRIAVVKEKQFISSSGSSDAIRYNHSSILIEIYDRKWTLLKRIALSREHESFNGIAGTIGMAIIGSNFHLVTNALGGILKASTVYAKINLQELKVEQYKTLDRLNARNMEPIEGGATLWMPNMVLLEYLDERGGLLKGKKDYHSIWQSMVL